MPGETIAFGPFRLDLRGHRLFRGQEPVALSAHLVDLLATFATHPGELLTKDALFAAAWPDVFVTDNTLARAVADLRHALGDDPANPAYIQTVARRGYRWVAQTASAPSAPLPSPTARGHFDELKQFVASVADLEGLRLDRLPEATRRLEEVARALPDYAPAHVALASAWALSAESTRSRARPDRDAAGRAVAAARRACDLDPALGEAWATLAFALTAAGEHEEARAAARQAVRLEPGSWRHHFRLALAAWGEERLRAARRTLDLLPAFPYACFLGATVLVARGLPAAAREMAAQGLTAGERGASDRLPASGLHWLTGAVLAPEAGEAEAALAAFAREIDGHDPARLYSTEFTLNARHWRAGLLARLGQTDEALADLHEALALEPGHPRSLCALAALLRGRAGAADARAIAERADTAIAGLVDAGREVEAAVCVATQAVIGDDAPGAVAALSRALEGPRPDHSGWTLPIEPWLQHLRGTAGFDALLRRLAQRAA